MNLETPVRNLRNKKAAYELYIKDGKVLRTDTNQPPSQVRHVLDCKDKPTWGVVARVRPCGKLVDVLWPGGTTTTQSVKYLRWSKKEAPKRMPVKKTEVHRTDGKIPRTPAKKAREGQA